MPDAIKVEKSDYVINNLSFGKTFEEITMILKKIKAICC